ncbi:hypothetical protein OIY81_2375 [Cryptosporidium canis]|uniref:Protein transport protein Sec61 subunit beta n=1 Tax=Cryptosporidium canis TaxID=195482 RepID=A0ABQ8P558_9CRYT|nr:hypothetical protein OJ252_2470 [Cryptosporidium canis]KAJ1609349.1 hypothetical protein OIY81_2375 [Cryptosporidium canis]
MLTYLFTDPIDKKRSTIREFFKCGSSWEGFNCKIRHNEVSAEKAFENGRIIPTLLTHLLFSHSRQRRALASSATSSRENLAQNLMSYYSDDTPGLKLGPMTVLVMTLAYMSIVIVLHILGKFKEAVMG